MSSKIFINQRQSKEDRVYKYKICTGFNLGLIKARRMRDWTINHIVLYLKSNTIKGKEIFSDEKVGDYDIHQLKAILDNIDLT